MKNRKYFNIFKIKNQIMYEKPTFDEIYQMIIHRENKNIINESVFKLSLFEQLFNYIKNLGKITCFTTDRLLDFFPINSKVFKILNHNKNLNNYKLYIFKDNFSTKDDIKNILEQTCGDEFNITEDVLNLIYEDLNSSYAMFTGLEDRKDFGIIWLYKDNFNIDDIQHEFIHYLEWMDKEYGRKINIDGLYFDEQETFQLMFLITNNDFEYIFDKSEYQTLLNNFLNQLENLKDKYFKELSDYRFARYIVFNILRDKNESVKQYLNKVQSFKYFKELLLCSTFGFEMVVGYNCLNYKITNIKNHIFGRFKNK